MFTAKFKDKNLRHRVVVDCSDDIPITEQNHKAEVNINNIVSRHGMDLINKVAAMQLPNMHFDDVTGNDFMEASLIIRKAEQSFSKMPSKIRKEFDNNPALFLDFVQNPDNKDKLVEMGLANAPKPAPAPVMVTISNPPSPETPEA